jgi:sugar phosphate isomerase/epimerase
MQSRRDFFKQASILMAGGVVAPHLLSSCIKHVHTHTHTHYYVPGTGSPQPFSAAGGSAAGKYLGLQLYSLREMVNDDGIEKVLELVAGMGYTHLEAASYNDGKFYGFAPAEFKKKVDNLGMKLSSSHLGRNISNNKAADMAWWDKAVEAHSAAGVKYMIMPSSPLNSTDGGGPSLQLVQQYCDYFNEIGKMTSTASMLFGYHNHDGEFKNKIDNVPVFDLMLKNTNAAHVLYQLDVYWIVKGGFDPVMYLKKYKDRIKVLHIKDEKAIGVHNVVDFKAVYNQAYANGIKDWFVEVEQYDGTPQEDVKKSADYLLNAGFVK